MNEEDIKKLEAKLGGFNENIDAKINAFKADMASKTKSDLDNLKKEIGDVLKEENKKRLDEINSRMDAVETASQRIEKAHEARRSFDSELGRVLKDLKGTNGSLRDAVRKNKGSGELEIKTDDMTTANTLTSVLEPQRIPGFVYDPDRTDRIRDLMPVGTTSASSVTFVYESAITDNTNITAEAQEFMQNDVDLAITTATVRKITNYIISSEELLDDLPGFQSYISARLPSKLKVKEDSQLLSGSGAGINISGFTTNATAYSDALADTNVTRIDVLVDACRQIVDDEYRPTAILLHPTDAWKIKLTKDTTGNYIHPWIFMQNNQIVLDGVPVVVTTAMTAGQFLVGDFQRGAQVFDRKQLSLEIAYQNEDNFIKGMVTIRVQERLALAIYRAKCFIYGGFTAALAQGTA